MKRGGFDNIATAIGGLMHITGPAVCLAQCQYIAQAVLCNLYVVKDQMVQKVSHHMS